MQVHHVQHLSQTQSRDIFGISEQNAPYQLARSQEDRFYLAMLMLWRVYVLGLEIEVQKQLRVNKVKAAKEFYQRRYDVIDELGNIMTHGDNF